MDIERRPVLVSDGVLTPEKEKRGGSSCFTWLPAGEVYLAPVPGTAEGKVVADLVFFEDRGVEQLRMTFKAGKSTSLGAKVGGERLRAVYKVLGPGKE
jgi:leucyl aminopeptidase (aminopeptidase T)